MTEAPRRIIWARKQSTCGSIIFPERPPRRKKGRDYVYQHPVADGRVGEMPVRYLSRGLARQSPRRQSYCGLRDGETSSPGDRAHVLITTHGNSGLMSVFFGTLASNIHSHSNIPVLVHRCGGPG